MTASHRSTRTTGPTSSEMTSDNLDQLDDIFGIKLSHPQQSIVIYFVPEYHRFTNMLPRLRGIYLIEIVLPGNRRLSYHQLASY